MVGGEQFGASRVKMDVVADGPQVTAATAIHDKCFVTAAKEVAREFMAAVKATGVRSKEPFHPGDEVRLRGFDDQVKMILHQAPGVNLPGGFDAGFREGF